MLVFLDVLRILFKKMKVHNVSSMQGYLVEGRMLTFNIDIVKLTEKREKKKVQQQAYPYDKGKQRRTLTTECRNIHFHSFSLRITAYHCLP